MRVFLDTNVIVSAVTTRGLCADVFRTVLAEHELITSTRVLQEVRRILQVKFGVSETSREKIKRRVLRKAEIVQPKTVPAVIADDPDDNHVLACAVEGNADLIVSGDRHLLSLKDYQGIPIVRPMDFLRTLGSA